MMTNDSRVERALEMLEIKWSFSMASLLCRHRNHQRLFKNRIHRCSTEGSVECHWAMKIKRHKTHSHKLIRLEKINGRRSNAPCRNKTPIMHIWIFQMNNKCGVLSSVWLSHEQYHSNEFYFLPLIASIPSPLMLCCFPRWRVIHQ